jgi:Cof subfamily protein (haloacid dehalogenase superfamily)
VSDVPVRLVGIDVDGTLVGSGGRVAPGVWEAAGRAREAGIHLVLCSGRPAFGLALDYARGLDAAGWHVFQNGSSIVNLASGASRSEAIREAAVKSLIAQARASGSVLELYSDREYVTESTTALARDHADLMGLPYQVRAFESLAGPIVRAQWVLNPDEPRRVLAAVPPGLEVAQATSPLMPGTQFVGLTAAGVNKGSAIRVVAAQHGLSLTDVMYVGDAGNDLPALAIVGYPVAMGNAAPAVLAAAAHHVGHVDQGGLADALEQALASLRR